MYNNNKIEINFYFSFFKCSILLNFWKVKMFKKDYVKQHFIQLFPL